MPRLSFLLKWLKRPLPSSQSIPIRIKVLKCELKQNRSKMQFFVLCKVVVCSLLLYRGKTNYRSIAIINLCWYFDLCIVIDRTTCGWLLVYKTDDRTSHWSKSSASATCLRALAYIDYIYSRACLMPIRKILYVYRWLQILLLQIYWTDDKLLFIRFIYSYIGQIGKNHIFSW